MPFLGMPFAPSLPRLQKSLFVNSDPLQLQMSQCLENSPTIIDVATALPIPVAEHEEVSLHEQAVIILKRELTRFGKGRQKSAGGQG